MRARLRSDVVMEEEQEGGRKGTRGNFYNNHVHRTVASRAECGTDE